METSDEHGVEDQEVGRTIAVRGLTQGQGQSKGYCYVMVRVLAIFVFIASYT